MFASRVLFAARPLLLPTLIIIGKSASSDFIIGAGQTHTLAVGGDCKVFNSPLKSGSQLA